MNTTQELQQLSETELQAKLQHMQQEYATLAEDVQAGKEQNHAQLRGMRKAIARTLTVLHSKKKSV